MPEYADALPYLPLACMVVVVVTYVATQGVGVSGVLTVVFFAALALGT
jgi:hypothetical protein